jgi:DNA-binding MarR family transcriptional regulator
MANPLVSEKRFDSSLSRRAKLQNGLLPGLIGSHLRRAESAVFERFRRIVADFGITPSEFGVLLLIHENSGLNQSELGKAIRADRSTIVALMNRFEERKLVTRQLSPLDRRSHALQLTSEGEALMQQLIPQVQQHERAIAAKLTRAEQAQLIELLTRLAN